MGNTALARHRGTVEIDLTVAVGVSRQEPTEIDVLPNRLWLAELVAGLLFVPRAEFGVF
jgi:hypothetical protein